MKSPFSSFSSSAGSFTSFWSISGAGLPMLRIGLTTSLSVLVVEALHIQSPYLALSSAVSFALLSEYSWQQYCINLGGITAGFLLSLILQPVAPQEPWLYIPLIGSITAIGHKVTRQKYGISCAIGFSTYFADPYIHTIYRHFYGHFHIFDIHYWVEGFIALTSCFLVNAVTQKKQTLPTLQKLTFSNMIVMMISIATASLVALGTGQAEPGRMVLANISTIVSMEIANQLGHIEVQSLGLFVGLIFSMMFITMTASWGNNCAAYIFTIGVTFALLELLRLYYKNWSAFYTTFAQMASLCIVMSPQPDRDLHVAIGRAFSTFLGFFVAAIVFFIAYYFRRFESHCKKLLHTD